MSAHTPGPFVTCTIQPMGEIKVWKRLPGTYESGKMLKVVPEDHRDSTYALVGGPNAESAASLIAAAPALLEALEAVGAAIHDHKTEPVVWVDSAAIAGLTQTVRAAIRAAKGEQDNG